MRFLDLNNQTIVSSPLRLSLFGGGTDIPYIYKKLGKGKTITASLDMFVTVGCTTRPFDKGVKLKYSSNEIAQDLDSIIHPIFKEALRYFNYNFEIEKGIEIFSTASIASGSGLGSSAAFTTSLMQCLSLHLKNNLLSNKDLLMLSTDIEHKSGNNQIGYQDQVASIFGSISIANYSKNDVKVIPASKEWDLGITKLIESKGALFKTNPRTGISSNYINSETLNKKIKMYKEVLKIADSIDFTENNFNEGKLINLLLETSYLAKKMKTRSKEVINIENQLEKLGAIYCKQLGAGGGGFIFCLFENSDPAIPDNLKEIMIRPKICKKGTRVLTI